MNIFQEILKYSQNNSLDKKQEEVIGLEKGYHLVLAPAGCGKTKILADRVNSAINRGISVEDMICLTFTNRASRGMKSRIKDIVGEEANNLFIGNTHRYCSKFLFDNNIVSQSTQIIDDEEQFSIINNLDAELNGKEDDNTSFLEYKAQRKYVAAIQLQHLMEQYRHEHPKDILLNNTAAFKEFDGWCIFYSPQLFASLCKEAGMSVSLDSIVRIYDNILINPPVVLTHYSKQLIDLMRLAKSYYDHKVTMGIIDFDDLLLLTYNYAKENQDSVKKYSWIQIDEVQDLNPLQFALVDLFTANDNVTIYLGDEQQAIFSFIGAKLSTLEWLKKRCSDNIHHLSICYRSPKYLLDIYNYFATTILDTDPDFLPKPHKNLSAKHGDLRMHWAYSNESVEDSILFMLNEYHNGRSAILVHSNAFADNISNILKNNGINHFKISGTDLFSLPSVKLLLAHLNVINSDINLMAWARILHGLNLITKDSLARKIVNKWKHIGINPSDFLNYSNSSYLLEFLKAFESKPIVFFDTETTGLNVFEDDIVQIAGIKYYKGEIIGKFNIILHTDKEIPLKLGDLVNPLIDEYAQRSHLKRNEGLRTFHEFAKDCVLIAHNANYDINILKYNCQRENPSINIEEEFPEVFDTLKLSRLVYPSLHSYKLKDLLVVMELEGENSHLADADIEATLNVAKFCYDKGNSLKQKIQETLEEFKELASEFKKKYGSLYNRGVDNLYDRNKTEEAALVTELKRAYAYFISNGFIKPFEKFEYICQFLEKEIIDSESEISLYEQLSNHITELSTFKEADLCDSSIIKENVFIATIHKAKGLEFENVIVFGCVDGVYPYFSNKDDLQAQKEDARKLYVAISRAKERLCFLPYEYKEGISQWGNPYRHPAELSPFLEGVLKNFNFVITKDSDYEN